MKRQCVWPSYEKHSKKSKGEIWHMSYDRKHRNIMERIS